MPPRARLSVGATGAAKFLMFFLGLFLLGFTGLVGLVAYGFAYGARESIGSSLGDGVWHRDAEGNLLPGPSEPGELDTTGIVGGVIGVVFGLVCFFVALNLILRSMRSGTWLRGSLLQTRGAVRTRSVDLATAAVSGGSSLTAIDPHTARKITIPLQRRSGPIPGEQLMMLANAITNARSRSGDNDKAFEVAEDLRRKARDPFS